MKKLMAHAFPHHSRRLRTKSEIELMIGITTHANAENPSTKNSIFIPFVIQYVQEYLLDLQCVRLQKTYQQEFHHRSLYPY